MHYLQALSFLSVCLIVLAPAMLVASSRPIRTLTSPMVHLENLSSKTIYAVVVSHKNTIGFGQHNGSPTGDRLANGESVRGAGVFGAPSYSTGAETGR
jgi:hypothetical protein